MSVSNAGEGSPSTGRSAIQHAQGPPAGNHEVLAENFEPLDPQLAARSASQDFGLELGAQPDPETQVGGFRGSGLAGGFGHGEAAGGPVRPTRLETSEF